MALLDQQQLDNTSEARDTIRRLEDALKAQRFYVTHARNADRESAKHNLARLQQIVEEYRAAHPEVAQCASSRLW